MLLQGALALHNFRDVTTRSKVETRYKWHEYKRQSRIRDTSNRPGWPPIFPIKFHVLKDWPRSYTLRIGVRRVLD